MNLRHIDLQYKTETAQRGRTLYDALDRGGVGSCSDAFIESLPSVELFNCMFDYNRSMYFLFKSLLEEKKIYVKRL